jgi:hypothetical protein
MLSTSKNIWGFDPRSVPGCVLWLDGGDNSTMNSTTTVTSWNDKSGQSNTMTGTATWNGTTMTFNGGTQAFSNLTFTFPYASFSLFGVFSNTTAPFTSAYMNVAYAGGGYPMIGTYDTNKFVTARGVVGNTGALVGPAVVGWAAQIAGTTTSTDIGYGVATDSSGNVFVIGSYGAALTLYNTGGTSGATLSFTGGFDCFVAKYSSAGAVVWAAQIAGTSGNDIGYAVATDSSGNVFVTGYYSAALTLYNTGGGTGATLPFTGGLDVFVAKYSSAGAVVWAAQIAGTTTSTDAGKAVATDSSGNVFVTGYYSAALTLYNTGGGTGATLAYTGGYDCFVAKYSSAGAVVWAAQIAGTSGNDNGYGIATDSSGNVFVTGYYSAALTLYNTGGGTGATLPFTGGLDVFVAKYSSAGAVVWAAQIAGTTTSTDVGYGIATDSSGNVFVTGYYSAALTLYNTGGGTGATLSFTGGSDVFVAKYSSAGAVVWAAQITGTTTANDVGYGIATDSSGNVFVTGQYAAALTLYNTNGTSGATLPFTGGAECFIAKYSSAGGVVCAIRIAATSTGAAGNGIATDSSGNVFVTGSYAAAVTLYNTGGTTGATLPFTGGQDCFLVKYSPDGFISNPSTPASSKVLVDVTYTGSTLSPYVNGSNQTTLSATTVTATGFYVGGPSNYFNGSVSELLIYNNTLTTNQRSAVEGYLASKWGVKSKLPTTHPFYVTPAFNRAFSPTDVPTCALWLDAADNSTMNSTTTVTTWNDKSGLSNTMTGTATWTGSNMTFNGSTQAFSNTSVVFPYTNFSMFGVYSNTTAPAASAYMNVMYATGGYPMIGTYDVNKYVSARGVVGNTGALSGQVGWATRIAGTGNDIGYAVATDSSGNVFVTGYYGAALTLYNTGGGTGATLPFTGAINVFVAKYSSAGAVVWATRIASAGVGVGYGIATDSSGNVFVTGLYDSGTLTLYNTGGGTGATLAYTGGYDCFVAKYSSAGAVVWATRVAGTTASSDFGYGIATDTSGNVFVTGYYGAALTLYNTGGGTGATLSWTGGNDCFVAKYSSAGAVVWATQITGTTTSGDIGQAVATDSSGNVFVTGSYSAALTLYNTGGTSGATLSFTGGTDVFVAKYSSAGVVVWAAQIAGTTTSTDVGYGIATDSSGNVFVTGSYSAALTLYNTGGGTGATLPFTGGTDVFVAKYSSAGAVVWAAQIAGTTTSSDFGYGIATDSSGNVFVTGYYSAALTLYNTGGGTGATLSFTGGSDVFIAKYSSAGAVSWAAQITGTTTSSDFGNGIATDSSGNVFVTGQYTAALTIYNTNGTTGATLANTGGNDVFLAKYSSTGYFISGTPASSNVLVDVTYTGTTLSPYINGSNQTTLTATTAAATGIYIGGPTNYFNGSISELLVYGSSLTAAQRQQVEGYLTQKWRLTSQVVSTHPYKTIPPSISLPAQYYEVTPGNWARDWQPYLQSLAAANSSGITYATSTFTGGATFTGNGWTGGVFAPDGNIYFSPAYALNILKLTVATGQTTNITGGATYTAVGWFDGNVLAPDGNIYSSPYVSANSLRLNVATGVTSNITGGGTFTSSGWRGGVLGPDGNIYFAPWNATNILKLTVATGLMTNITGGATYTANGWISGVLGPDGNIYFAPHSAPNILKLNVATGQTTNITGGATYTATGWYGGALGPDGNIYFTPHSALNILKLNVATGQTTNITGGATYTSNGGWNGATVGPDGNIYFCPYAALNILQLNVSTGVTSNIFAGATYTSAGWHGGVLATDGNIYFAPFASASVLKLTFTGLKQLPSSNYCLTTWNKF